MMEALGRKDNNLNVLTNINILVALHTAEKFYNAELKNVNTLAAHSTHMLFNHMAKGMIY
jgi:hypothetical protein